MRQERSAKEKKLKYKFVTSTNPYYVINISGGLTIRG